MSNKNSIEPFARSSSEGLGWADQWDYKFNDTAYQEQQTAAGAGGGGGTKKEKMADMGRKAKSAASTGFAKAKVGASVAATKMSQGVGWMKQKGLRVFKSLKCWGKPRYD
ncbi:unnamed protein product [Calypogeia fissa]